MPDRFASLIPTHATDVTYKPVTQQQKNMSAKKRRENKWTGVSKKKSWKT